MKIIKYKISYKINVQRWTRCILFVLLLSTNSCRKFVEVAAPSTSLTGASVYASDATATSVLTGIYTRISSNFLRIPGSIPSLTLYAGLSSDEFTLYSGSTDPGMIAYYQNALAAGPGLYGTDFWNNIYPYIFSCNDAIVGLTQSNSLSANVKQQLLGEAFFMRAFFYFYMVNLYGDVPLMLTTDYKVNSVASRASASQVYQQIITDLLQADSKLNANYLDATLIATTTDRVRPTKWAAEALLARAYLYTKDWANAEKYSDMVIKNTSLFGLLPLNQVFLKAAGGVNEAIWQLQPVNAGWNTEDAKAFIIPPTGPGTGGFNLGVYLSPELSGSFEPTDQRKSVWVNSTIFGGSTYLYPYKYKINTFNTPVTEYYMVLRLGEQYLIRAEAEANNNQSSQAMADLNVIRTRAGLPNYNATANGSLLIAIQHERQVEMFAELGQRWLDLKRTGTVDAVMSTITPLKGGTWHSYQQLYPIYYQDIRLNPKIIQNPGY